jgi:hypothetical protein
VRGGGINEEKRMVWLMYFLYMYEYGTVKPVEVIARRGIREGD